MERKADKILLLVSKKLGLDCVKYIFESGPFSRFQVLTIDDRNDSRSVFPAIHGYCADKGIGIQVAANRKHSESLIREFAPDVCFASGWYWLIPGDVLDSVPMGIVGPHNSLLPKYRGGSPLVWAMINGEAEVGVTLISLSEGMDDGDVWAQRATPIGEDDYVHDVLERLESHAFEMLRENFHRIISGKFRPQPQDLSNSTFCAQRVPEDGLIQWNKAAREIRNFIRAQSHPYPGAYTFIAGEKLTIWEAALDPVVYYGSPGQIAKIDPAGGVHVICGDNTPLILGKVSGGAGIVNARELVKSFKVRLG